MRLLPEKTIEIKKIHYKNNNYFIKFKCSSYIETKNTLDSIILFHISRINKKKIVQMKLKELINFYITLKIDKSLKYSIGNGIYLLEEYHNIITTINNKNMDEKQLNNICNIIYNNKNNLNSFGLLSRRLKRSLVKLIDKDFYYAKFLYFIIFNVIHIRKNNDSFLENYDYRDSYDDIDENIDCHNTNFFENDNFSIFL